MADTVKFELGAVVQLRSGGPAMTVQYVSTDDDGDDVICKWWNPAKSEFETESFWGYTLRLGADPF